MRDHQTVLILGASGRFGRHACAAFTYAGWKVRQFDRRTDTLWDAAWGADVIVNAWNPPYAQWAREVPQLTRQVIEVAKASGATVLIPGNVYPYGMQPGPWSAATAHRAVGPLGQIRVDMEAAYRTSGVRTIILRGGDFLDTQASGNWFDAVITKGLHRGRMTYPGPLNVPHAWAFLPDMADAAVALAKRRYELKTFIDVPFSGYTLTGQQISDAEAKVAKRSIQTSRMGWWPLHVSRPVWPMAKHLLEMRYLWSHPHSMDNQRLADLCPDLRPTPLHEALSLAVQDKINPDQTVRASIAHRLCKGACDGPQHA